MFSIAEEFKKNAELKQDDVDQIKDWLTKQPHLPKISDQQIIVFLHSCNYKMELTKTTIDNFFTIRTVGTEIFSKRDPKLKEVQEALQTVYLAKLPGKTSEGYDVFISKLKRMEPEYYNFAAVIKLYHMHCDLLWKDHGTSPGAVFLIDMQGFSLGHVARLNVTVLKHHICYLQEALPMKLKGIHLLNIVPFIDMIMNMMKPFMKSELQKMFHYHQADCVKLYKYVPKSVLPKDYGGEAPCYEDLQTQTIEDVLANEKWFKEEELLRVDESKRQGKSKSVKDEWDMSGSFKKLNLD